MKSDLMVNFSTGEWRQHRRTEMPSRFSNSSQPASHSRDRPEEGGGM